MSFTISAQRENMEFVGLEEFLTDTDNWEFNLEILWLAPDFVYAGKRLLMLEIKFK